MSAPRTRSCSGEPGSRSLSWVKSTWVSARVSAPRRFCASCGVGPGTAAGGAGGVVGVVGIAVVAVAGAGADVGAGAGSSSWGGAVLADTVNATSSLVNASSIHPSKAVIASQDMCTVCKHRITPC